MNINGYYIIPTVECRLLYVMNIHRYIYLAGKVKLPSSEDPLYPTDESLTEILVDKHQTVVSLVDK